jgi:hypothetical protein
VKPNHIDVMAVLLDLTVPGAKEQALREFFLERDHEEQLEYWGDERYAFVFSFPGAPLGQDGVIRGVADKETFLEIFVRHVIPELPAYAAASGVDLPKGCTIRFMGNSEQMTEPLARAMREELGIKPIQRETVQ